MDIMVAFGVNSETAYAIVTVFLLGYVVGVSDLSIPLKHCYS